MIRLLAFISIIISGFCIASLEAARERISLAPKAGYYSTEDIEKEILFGREMAAVVLADNTLHYDQRLNLYVSLVGHSLLRFSARSELNFYFSVIESGEINAYATPGGYIFVTTAALSLMKNEAELAAVLAHEIAHVADRHIVKALKIRSDDKSTTAMVSKLATNNVESAKVIFDQAVGQAIDILFSKGLQVDDETEADLQAVLLVTSAGYNPSHYLKYLSRIKPHIESSRGELSRTHPSFDDRINRLQNLIGDEALLASTSIVNAERFLSHLRSGGIK